MAVKKMKLSKWQKLVDELDAPADNLGGPSPGGAATELGMSRQGVHQCIKRGTLDAVGVYDDHSGKLCFYMVTQESIEAYKVGLRERDLATLKRISKRLA